MKRGLDEFQILARSDSQHIVQLVSTMVRICLGMLRKLSQLEIIERT